MAQNKQLPNKSERLKIPLWKIQLKFKRLWTLPDITYLMSTIAMGIVIHLWSAWNCIIAPHPCCSPLNLFTFACQTELANKQFSTRIPCMTIKLWTTTIMGHKFHKQNSYVITYNHNGKPNIVTTLSISKRHPKYHWTLESSHTAIQAWQIEV